MHKNVIFCYSGTGNCLDLAKNIAHGIGGADIIMIRSKPSVTDVSEAEKIGFVFPCYGGGAPEDFLKYAAMIRVNPKAYVFGISQSACYTGIGLSSLNSIIKLNYWKAVTHHCSCIWLFPHTVMLPMLSLENAQARSESLAKDIAEDIRNGKNSARKPPRNIFNVLENKIWPKLAKTRVAAFKVNDACIVCGQCEKICPRGNIKIENGRARIGRNCIQCLGCLQYCPKNAISIGKITDRREHYHNPNISVSELTQEIITIE